MVYKLLSVQQALIVKINQIRMLSRWPHMVKFATFLIVGLLSFSLLTNYCAASKAPAQPYKTSWVGNTFGGGKKWIQLQINDIHIADNGTVYTNSTWDEGGHEAGVYKDGDVLGKSCEMHGWGKLGGKVVTTNSKYVYLGMQQDYDGKPGEDYPEKGKSWYTVRRCTLSGESAPFPNGRGPDKSVLIVNTSKSITGLANAGKELYVSDPAGDKIRVYDREDMTELRSWSFPRPGKLTVDRQNNLWIIQTAKDGNKSKIRHYTNTGKQLPEEITDVVEPTALTVDRQGRLLVAENGPRQQVLIYNIAGKPKLVGTLGEASGIYAGKRGEVGDLKLTGLSGVGTDAGGNIYVSNDGFNSTGSDLRKFSPQGKLLWRLLGLQFVDNADADPGSDGVDVFTKNEHFVMDYSKNNGKEWSYKGYTLDKFRYPDDARLHISPSAPFVRRLNGQRFLFLSADMMAERLLIYRFDGEIAVPAGMFTKNNQEWPANQPNDASWLWRDKNGNGAIEQNEYETLGKPDDSIWGWEVDSKGDIWQAAEAGYIKRYRFQGLDSYGSPIYNSKAAEKIAMPAPFKELTRIKYIPDQDVMYLGGYTNEHPRFEGDWGTVGTEIIRFDNWSKNKKIRWRTKIPYDLKADPIVVVKAMDVAGDKVFAVTSRKAEVYVYDARTGAAVSKFVPGPEVAGESGWVDIPYGLRAYQRKNGEYLVFVEEDAKAKVIMYRWRG